MAKSTDTVRRMARPRGEVTDAQMRRLQKVVDKANAAEAAMRAEFVAVLDEGASFAELSRASGVSTSTLQKWRKVAGK